MIGGLCLFGVLCGGLGGFVGCLGVCCAWFVCVVSLTWCFVVTGNASVVGLRLVVCVVLGLVLLIWVLILLNLRFGCLIWCCSLFLYFVIGILFLCFSELSVYWFIVVDGFCAGSYGLVCALVGWLCWLFRWCACLLCVWAVDLHCVWFWWCRMISLGFGFWWWDECYFVVLLDLLLGGLCLLL